MTPQEADKAQDWKGMDGATAFLLIRRHADGWDEVREMMNAWLRANPHVMERSMKALELATALELDTAAKAVALAVIKNHEGSKT